MPAKVRTTRVSTRAIRRKTPEAERAALPPHIDLPDPPLYEPVGEQKALYDEQQVSRVELLLIKGIRHRRQIMTLLDIKDPAAADRYIARVHARWEMVGSAQDHARHRGEGLQRLDLIESELWTRLQKTEQQTTLAVNILAHIAGIQKQRAEMLGLTPKIIERLGDINSGDGVEFSRQVTAHEKLALVASRMLKLIEERTSPKVIEHGRTSDEA